MQLVVDRALDPALGHQLPRRHRRHLARHGAADHGADAAQRAGQLAATSPSASAASTPCMLTLLTGMVGVFIALDLFLFYVFFEVMLIPMYFIIGIWGGTNRLYAAIKFFIYTMAGSLLMLVAIVVHGVEGRGAPPARCRSPTTTCCRTPARLGTAAPWLFAAFALAFAIKVPIFPFHTWLPDAHVEAPTAGSVLLAGVMLKIGTYGFLRFAVPFFPQVALSPGVSRADGGAGGHRDHLRRAGGDGAARHQEARGLLLGEPPRLRDAGDLGRHPAERAGRADGDDQPRLLDRRAVPSRSACCTSGATPGSSRTTAASRGWCRSSA